MIILQSMIILNFKKMNFFFFISGSQPEVLELDTLPN